MVIYFSLNKLADGIPDLGIYEMDLLAIFNSDIDVGNTNRKGGGRDDLLSCSYIILYMHISQIIVGVFTARTSS